MSRFAPPYMRRLQRTFPQPTQEAPKDVPEATVKVSLEAVMQDWEETSEAPARCEVSPPVVAVDHEEEGTEAMLTGEGALDNLMRLSRKRLVHMAEEKHLSLPARATKQQIAELLLEHGK